MHDFKALAGTMITADGRRLKENEELAMVMRLAVEKIKEQLQQEEKVLELNRQRITIVMAGLIVFLALIGTWWVQSHAIIGGMNWIMGGVIGGLFAAALLYIYIPRSEGFSIKPDEARITYLGLFYWPIRILPLSDERALFCDALTPTDSSLEIITLSPDWGVEEIRSMDSAQTATEGLSILLKAGEALRVHKLLLSGWATSIPDESLQLVAQEVSDLWQEMNPISSDQLGAALRFSQDKIQSADWQRVREAAQKLQTFYQGKESVQNLREHYRVRSEELVNRAYALLLEHGRQTNSDVENDRAAYFSAPAKPSQEPPTNPTAALRLTLSDSRTQIKQTLAALQSALLPLDAEIAKAQDVFKTKETFELQAAEEDFNEHREQLTDLKKEIETTDSSIFNLVLIIEDHQNKLHHYASLIQQSSLSLAQVPLAALQAQVEHSYNTLHDTLALIRDSNLKLEFIAVESSLERLKESLDHALNEWQTLSKQMPLYSQEVAEKVEIALDILKGLVAHPQLAQEKGLDQQIQAAIKEMQRVPRTLISWNARQQSPIDGVEDNHNELSAHLVALRDYRHKLELASENLTALSYADSGRPVTLPLSLQQIKSALLRFTELSEESLRTIRSMDETADLMAKQADTIGEVLKERESLLKSYKQKISALQEAELKEHHQIRQRWQHKRDSLELKRADMNRLQKTVLEQLNRPREMPDIRQTGMILEGASWADQLLNLMKVGVARWGERIAGIDLAEAREPTVLQQLQDELERCDEEIKSYSVRLKLPATAQINEPELCFIPFWYVESQSKAKGKEQSGRMIHIFPPLELGKDDKEIPAIKKVAYDELTRRLLNYLRHDEIKNSKIALSFSSASLSHVAEGLDFEAASPSAQRISDTFTQYSLLFEAPDPTTEQLIKNSRQALICTAPTIRQLCQL